MKLSEKKSRWRRLPRIGEITLLGAALAWFIMIGSVRPSNMRDIIPIWTVDLAIPAAEHGDSA